MLNVLRLFQELAELASETRHSTAEDGKNIFEKLTVVIGYVNLAETHPTLKPILQRHLEAFMDLSKQSYPDACAHSEKILTTIRQDPEFTNAA